MMVLMNVGVVEFSGDFNALPVVLGIVLIIVGLLGYAAVWRCDAKRKGPIPPVPMEVQSELPPPEKRVVYATRVTGGREMVQALEDEMDKLADLVKSEEFDRLCRPMDMPDFPGYQDGGVLPKGQSIFGDEACGCLYGFKNPLTEQIMTTTNVTMPPFDVVYLQKIREAMKECDRKLIVIPNNPEILLAIHKARYFKNPCGGWGAWPEGRRGRRAMRIDDGRRIPPPRRKYKLPRYREDLLALREGLGLTQEQMGKRMGASKSAVQKWEYGERNPRIKHRLIYDALRAELNKQQKIVGC